MKKILLICIGLFGLFVCGCSTSDKPYKGLINEDKKVVSDSRIQVVTRNASDGASLVIFLDTKTGREFLYYSHSMVEIKPKDEK